MMEVGNCSWEEIMLLADERKPLEKSSSSFLSTWTSMFKCIPMILDVSEHCSIAVQCKQWLTKHKFKTRLQLT